MNHDDAGVRWLLASDDPSVRYLTRLDLLEESERSREVRADRAAILGGPRVRSLLSGQRADGGFGVHWYKKWAGATWRLVSAVELGVPPETPAVRRAAEHVLSRLPWAHAAPRPVRGRVRVHASVLGNPLGVCARLGLADDLRVARIAESLARWQWADGGWNCDPTEEAHHSSFYESLVTLWGISEYFRATHDPTVGPAVDRAAEFFLRHRLFRSCRGERVIDARWTRLHYPLYWHYDILQALRVLAGSGHLHDPRAREAIDLVAAKRTSEGTWLAEGRFWHPGVRSAANTDVVDWGLTGPNEMITLNALRVLRAAGRID